MRADVEQAEGFRFTLGCSAFPGKTNKGSGNSTSAQVLSFRLKTTGPSLIGKLL